MLAKPRGYQMQLQNRKEWFHIIISIFRFILSKKNTMEIKE